MARDFQKAERNLKQGEEYKLLSYATSSESVEMTDGTDLQTKMDAVDKNISDEVTRATAKENEIASNLSAEVTRATSAEQDLDSTKADKTSVYTKNEVDNKFSTLETNIDWKESVVTYSDIATTYPNPEDGWTVNVKDTDYTYRYNGTEWVTISANAIPKATDSVDGLLSKEDHAKYEDANNKKHTHDNKSIIDKITQSLLDAWDSAVTHISDTVKHITSSERTNWNTAYTHSQSAHAPTNAQANVIETVKVNGTALTPSSKAVDIAVPTLYAGSSSAGGAANSVTGTLSITDLTNGNAELKTYNGSSDLSITIPMNTDTHYTSHLYVGASGGNANATSATSNPYLLCVDNTTNRNSIQLKAGNNMSINAVNGVVTFTATNTTYSAATTSKAGLMSASDKSKLDGIASGANAYSLPTASSSTLGGVKTTSTVTSTSGLTACPIISGVPYYKDTNTTYTLAGLMGSSAKGSTTQPIYWTGSAFANTSYTLAKSVPSNAVFTDTWRGINSTYTSKITNASTTSFSQEGAYNMYTALNSNLTKGSATSYSSNGYTIYYQKITNNIYQIYMQKILSSTETTIDWILGSNFPVKPTVTQILPLFMHVAGNVVGIGYISFFSDGTVHLSCPAYGSQVCLNAQGLITL